MRLDTSRRRVLKAVGAGVGVAGTVSSITAGAQSGTRLRVRERALPNWVVVRGEDLFTGYEFAVSGRVNGGDAADLTDFVGEDRVRGFVADGSVDDFLFSGEITEFADDDDLTVWINGRRVGDPVGEPAPGTGRDRRETAPECHQVEPLSYRDWTVGEFYGYDPADEPGGRQSSTPVDLAEPGVSRLFFYEGPEGLSLVMIHDGDREAGGAASFRIEGVPSGVDWVVSDDGDDGATDEFAVEDGVATADWAWGVRTRNDGGALGYLPDEFGVTIFPRFGEAATLEPFQDGEIRRWELLSGDVADPDVHELPLGEPALLLTGNC